MSASNHDSTVQVSQEVIASTGAPVAGEGDPMAGSEVTLHFTISQDLGLNGSVSLVAQVSNVTSGINPSVFPFLTYLSDGTNEYINLTRGNNGASCDSGIMSCDASGNCNPNPNCSVGYPSAYGDFYHYMLHQTPSWGYDTINTFPTCRWSEGTTGNGATYTSSSPACAFHSYLDQSQGHLPVGSYTAKYFLVADQYASVTGATADLKVTVVQKKANANSQIGGAIDYNVILVGSKNIQDSHTPAGQRNLNTLFKSVADYLGTPNVNLSIGKVNVYEMNCESGGDNFAMVSSDNIGSLLQSGSAMVDPASEGKALNVFLISQFGGIGDGGILGLSGAIGGPMINGLQTSGLTFATFNELAAFNPGCTTSPCPLTSQDADFYEMGNTIAHETGHYLGLNHPSESAGTIHDNVYDTPTCSTVSAASGTITIGSCLSNDASVFGPTGLTCHQTCTGYNSATGSFCPEARECAFNHMMWWSSKHFYPGTGAADGNQFSPDSGIIMNMNPFVQ